MSIFDIFREIESGVRAKSSVEWLVVGLGNPGAEYNGTRHNVGFAFLDAFAKKHGADVMRSKFQAFVGEATVSGKRILLVKPQTYMNLSGKSVAEAAKFYKIPAERVLVVHDDVSLDVGRIRIRRQGSAGGHNGLKSIIADLPGQNFPRIKIGVGKNEYPDLADWVLGKFPHTQQAALDEAIKKAISATEIIIGGDIETAMCNYSR